MKEIKCMEFSVIERLGAWEIHVIVWHCGVVAFTIGHCHDVVFFSSTSSHVISLLTPNTFHLTWLSTYLDPGLHHFNLNAILPLTYNSFILHYFSPLLTCFILDIFSVIPTSFYLYHTLTIALDLIISYSSPIPINDRL